MLIGVSSIGKGRGVTTVACGLGAAFAAEVGAAVLIECDPTGGDIAAWRDLKTEIGVNQFAIRSEAASLWDEVVDTTWETSGQPGLRIMPMQLAGPGLRQQVETLRQRRLPELKSLGCPVVMDLGREADATPVMRESLDAMIFVAAGDVAGLTRLRNAKERVDTSIVLVNGSAFDLAQIVRSTDVNVFDLLAWQTRTAEAIRCGEWKRPKRQVLGRQFARLAHYVGTEFT